MEKLRLILKCLGANLQYKQQLRQALFQINSQLKYIQQIKRQQYMPIANKKNTPKSQKRVKVTSQCFIQNKRLLTRYTQPLTNEEAAQIIRLFREPLQIDSFKWTDEEDNILKYAVERFGNQNWREISNLLSGRHNAQCYHRWMKTINPEIKRGRWTHEEDIRLVVAIKIFGTSNWVRVSEYIKGKTDVQCRERYCNVLNTQISQSNWSKFEDFIIVIGAYVYKSKWSKIAQVIQARTDNQCRRRFKYLSKRWDFFQSFAKLRLFKDNLPQHIKSIFEECDDIANISLLD